MVGKEVCWLLDKIVVLKDEGKMNLFADFPIGATIQDGGKRKKLFGHIPLYHQRKLKKEILNQGK